MSIESGLNRRQRRYLERSSRTTGTEAENNDLPQGGALIPKEQILAQEDDISLLRREERLYTSAQVYTLIEINAYNALRQLGIADATCKGVIIDPNLISMEDLKRQIFSQIGARRAGAEDLKKFNHWKSASEAMLRKKKFYDPDETDVIRSLIKDDNISGRDILNEIARARWESIDLIRMQIDWLKKRQVLASKQKKADQKIENTVEMDTGRKTEEKRELPEISIDSNREAEEPFSLKGWGLFITKSSPLSSDDSTAWNHLTSIPTDSRQEALGAIAVLTQGKASIKSISILSALEFHLIRKDVIQKALATRVKYGPNGARDWVKLKRGKDRILLLIPSPDEKRAIFFVEGRDIVYRSN